MRRFVLLVAVSLAIDERNVQLAVWFASKFSEYRTCPSAQLDGTANAAATTAPTTSFRLPRRCERSFPRC